MKKKYSKNRKSKYTANETGDSRSPEKESAKRGGHAAGKEGAQDFLSSNPAADLEQSLKSRMNSLPYRRLIRDIRVSAGRTGTSLHVTIVPAGEAYSFSIVSVSLSSIDNAAKWKRKKKDVFSIVRNCQLKLKPDISQKIREEVSTALHTWREEHPFSDEMKEALSSRTAAEFFNARRLQTLRFLAGKEMPGSAHTIFTADAAELEFKGCPFKAVCDLRTGRTGFSLSKADWLYKQFLLAMKEFGTHEAVSAYLREKGIDASVYYAGKPGQFRILFRFPLSTETENVEIESAYKRIVLAARKRAAEKALVKEKEKAAQLKICPCFGTYIAQAALTCAEENGGRLTKAQLVNLLRGTNVSADYVFGEYAGRYNLIPKAEIARTLDTLIQFGILREYCVHGEYQKYYVCHVTAEGKLFERLQKDPAPKKNPEFII
jgi:hypothetical protein